MPAARTSDHGARPHARGVSRAPMAFHDTLRFSIDYHGRIDNGSRADVIEPEGREHRPQQNLEPGGGRQQPFLVPDLRLPERQIDLGASRPPTAEYTSSRTAGWWPTGGIPTGRTPSRASGPATARPISCSHRRASGPARRHLRGMPVELLCVPRRLDRARRLFGVTPDMIEVTPV